MFPLVPEELGQDFSLERVLRFGSIPLIWSAEDKKKALEAYVQMYLKEEIRAEALVRNLPGFLRFLPIAGLFHGQVVNVSAVARDSGTARTTVNGYLVAISILDRNAGGLEGNRRAAKDCAASPCLAGFPEPEDQRRDRRVVGAKLRGGIGERWSLWP